MPGQRSILWKGVWLGLSAVVAGGAQRPTMANSNEIKTAQEIREIAGSLASVSLPDEISAHMEYMSDFAARLEGSGELVDVQSLAPDGMFVRYGGEGRPPLGCSSEPHRRLEFQAGCGTLAGEARLPGVSAGPNPLDASRDAMSCPHARATC